MACKLERPAPQDLFDRIRDNFSSNVLFGGDVVPESNEWYVVSNDYKMQEELYTIVEEAYKSKDPRYACCEDLYDIAARRGVYPNPATFSQGYVRVTGNVGVFLPNPLEVMIADQRFIGTGSVAPQIPGVGYVDLRVQAVVPGTGGNIAVRGVTGSLTTSVSGLDNEVKVYGSTFCGGAEQEGCEQFRARFMERLSYKPKATHSWLMEEILSWPCVTRVAHRGGACCTTQGDNGPDCACNTCTNKLQYYPLFDDTFDCGIPPECVIIDMNNWLFGAPQGRGLGRVEIGVCGKLFAPVAGVADVRIQGLGCASQSQIATIKSRIREVFARATPSDLLKVRAIETTINQVMGDDNDYIVTFKIRSGDMSLTPCGDLDPKCDVMPCLGDIVIINSAVSINVC